MAFYVFVQIRRKGARYGVDPKSVADGLDSVTEYFADYYEETAVYCHGDKLTAAAVAEHLTPTISEEQQNMDRYDVIETAWYSDENDLDFGEREKAQAALVAPSEYVQRIRDQAMRIACKRFPMGVVERRILNALKNVAVKKEQLILNKTCNQGNISRKGGPLNNLTKWGFIMNKRRLGGYVRLDAPPAD